MKSWKYIFSFLLLIAVTVWLSTFTLPGNNLKIIACDVGQGDGILIQQGANQILVDGGPNNKILDCLGRYLPFWDREIELVVLTHPDKDHYFGLIEVFKRYRIKNYLTSGAVSSSEGFKVLEKEVRGSGVKVIEGRRGQKLKIDLMQLDIVNPDNLEVKGGNSNSIVFYLTFADFEGFLTGDIEPKTIGELVQSGVLQDIDYLKVPHHGSKNGLTQELLELTKPEISVISAGKNNSYGHPHEEVLGMLSEFRTLRTDEVGDVVVETNGQEWWVD